MKTFKLPRFFTKPMLETGTQILVYLDAGAELEVHRTQHHPQDAEPFRYIEIHAKDGDVTVILHVADPRELAAALIDGLNWVDEGPD